MRDPLPSLPGYALRRAANATAADLAQMVGQLGPRCIGRPPERIAGKLR